MANPEKKEPSIEVVGDFKERSPEDQKYYENVKKEVEQDEGIRKKIEKGILLTKEEAARMREIEMNRESRKKEKFQEKEKPPQEDFSQENVAESAESAEIKEEPYINERGEIVGANKEKTLEKEIPKKETPEERQVKIEKAKEGLEEALREKPEAREKIIIESDDIKEPEKSESINSEKEQAHKDKAEKMERDEQEQQRTADVIKKELEKLNKEKNKIEIEKEKLKIVIKEGKNKWRESFGPLAEAQEEIERFENPEEYLEHLSEREETLDEAISERERELEELRGVPESAEGESVQSSEEEQEINVSLLKKIKKNWVGKFLSAILFGFLGITKWYIKELDKASGGKKKKKDKTE